MSADQPTSTPAPAPAPAPDAPAQPILPYADTQFRAATARFAFPVDAYSSNFGRWWMVLDSSCLQEPACGRVVCIVGGSQGSGTKDDGEIQHVAACKALAHAIAHALNQAHGAIEEDWQYAGGAPEPVVFSPGDQRLAWAAGRRDADFLAGLEAERERAVALAVAAEGARRAAAGARRARGGS